MRAMSARTTAKPWQTRKLDDSLLKQVVSLSLTQSPTPASSSSVAEYSDTAAFCMQRRSAFDKKKCNDENDIKTVPDGGSIKCSFCETKLSDHNSLRHHLRKEHCLDNEQLDIEIDKCIKVSLGETVSQRISADTIESLGIKRVPSSPKKNSKVILAKAAGRKLLILSSEDEMENTVKQSIEQETMTTRDDQNPVKMGKLPKSPNESITTRHHCSFCEGHSYRYKQDLRKHIKTKHPGKIEKWDARQAKQKTAAVALKYSCGTCSEKFSNINKMKVHVNKHKRQAKTNPKPKIKKESPPESLQDSIKKSMRDLECAFCRQKCISKPGIVYHLKIIHFCCNLCHIMLPDKETWRDHMGEQHKIYDISFKETKSVKKENDKKSMERKSIKSEKASSHTSAQEKITTNYIDDIRLPTGVILNSPEVRLQKLPIIMSKGLEHENNSAETSEQGSSNSMEHGKECQMNFQGAFAAFAENCKVRENLIRTDRNKQNNSKQRKNFVTIDDKNVNIATKQSTFPPHRRRRTRSAESFGMSSNVATVNNSIGNLIHDSSSSKPDGKPCKKKNIQNHETAVNDSANFNHVSKFEQKKKAKVDDKSAPAELSEELNRFPDDVVIYSDVSKREEVMDNTVQLTKDVNHQLRRCSSTVKNNSVNNMDVLVAVAKMNANRLKVSLCDINLTGKRKTTDHCYDSRRKESSRQKVQTNNIAESPSCNNSQKTTQKDCQSARSDKTSTVGMKPNRTRSSERALDIEKCSPARETMEVRDCEYLGAAINKPPNKALRSYSKSRVKRKRSASPRFKGYHSSEQNLSPTTRSSSKAAEMQSESEKYARIGSSGFSNSPTEHFEKEDNSHRQNRVLRGSLAQHRLKTNHANKLKSRMIAHRSRMFHSANQYKKLPKTIKHERKSETVCTTKEGADSDQNRKKWNKKVTTSKDHDKNAKMKTLIKTETSLDTTKTRSGKLKKGKKSKLKTIIRTSQLFVDRSRTNLSHRMATRKISDKTDESKEYDAPKKSNEVKMTEMCNVKNASDTADTTMECSPCNVLNDTNALTPCDNENNSIDIDKAEESSIGNVSNKMDISKKRKTRRHSNQIVSKECSSKNIFDKSKSKEVAVVQEMEVVGISSGTDEDVAIVGSERTTFSTDNQSSIKIKIVDYRSRSKSPKSHEGKKSVSANKAVNTHNLIDETGDAKNSFEKVSERIFSNSGIKGLDICSDGMPCFATDQINWHNPRADVDRTAVESIESVGDLFHMFIESDWERPEWTRKKIETKIDYQLRITRNFIDQTRTVVQVIPCSNIMDVPLKITRVFAKKERVVVPQNTNSVERTNTVLPNTESKGLSTESSGDHAREKSKETEERRHSRSQLNDTTEKNEGLSKEESKVTDESQSCESTLNDSTEDDASLSEECSENDEKAGTSHSDTDYNMTGGKDQETIHVEKGRDDVSPAGDNVPVQQDKLESKTFTQNSEGTEFTRDDLNCTSVCPKNIDYKPAKHFGQHHGTLKQLVRPKCSKSQNLKWTKGNQPVKVFNFGRKKNTEKKPANAVQEMSYQPRCTSTPKPQTSRNNPTKPALTLLNQQCVELESSVSCMDTSSDSSAEADLKSEDSENLAEKSYDVTSGQESASREEITDILDFQSQLIGSESDMKYLTKFVTEEFLEILNKSPLKNTVLDNGKRDLLEDKIFKTVVESDDNEENTCNVIVQPNVVRDLFNHGNGLNCDLDEYMKKLVLDLFQIVRTPDMDAIDLPSNHSLQTLTESLRKDTENVQVHEEYKDVASDDRINESLSEKLSVSGLESGTNTKVDVPILAGEVGDTTRNSSEATSPIGAINKKYVRQKYVCKICKKKYERQLSAVNHIKTRHSSFKVTDNDYSEYLETGLNHVIAGEKRGFPSSQELSTDSAVKRYLCTVCQGSYKSKHGTHRHIREKHAHMTALDDWKTRLVDITYAIPIQLSPVKTQLQKTPIEEVSNMQPPNEMLPRTDTEEEPRFQCQYCVCQYRNEDNIYHHIKTCHPEQALARRNHDEEMHTLHDLDDSTDMSNGIVKDQDITLKASSDTAITDQDNCPKLFRDTTLVSDSEVGSYNQKYFDTSVDMPESDGKNIKMNSESQLSSCGESSIHEKNSLAGGLENLFNIEAEVSETEEVELQSEREQLSLNSNTEIYDDDIDITPRRQKSSSLNTGTLDSHEEKDVKLTKSYVKLENMPLLREIMKISGSTFVHKGAGPSSYWKMKDTSCTSDTNQGMSPAPNVVATEPSGISGSNNVRQSDDSMMKYKVDVNITIDHSQDSDINNIERMKPEESLKSGEENQSTVKSRAEVKKNSEKTKTEGSSDSKGKKRKREEDKANTVMTEFELALTAPIPDSRKIKKKKIEKHGSFEVVNSSVRERSVKLSKDHQQTSMRPFSKIVQNILRQKKMEEEKKTTEDIPTVEYPAPFEEILNKSSTQSSKDIDSKSAKKVTDVYKDVLASVPPVFSRSFKKPEQTSSPMVDRSLWRSPLDDVDREYSHKFETPTQKLSSPRQCLFKSSENNDSFGSTTGNSTLGNSKKSLLELMKDIPSIHDTSTSKFVSPSENPLVSPRSNTKPLGFVARETKNVSKSCTFNFEAVVSKSKSAECVDKSSLLKTLPSSDKYDFIKSTDTNLKNISRTVTNEKVVKELTDSISTTSSSAVSHEKKKGVEENLDDDNYLDYSEDCLDENVDKDTIQDSEKVSNNEGNNDTSQNSEDVAHDQKDNAKVHFDCEHLDQHYSQDAIDDVMDGKDTSSAEDNDKEEDVRENENIETFDVQNLNEVVAEKDDEKTDEDDGRVSDMDEDVDEIQLEDLEDDDFDDEDDVQQNRSDIEDDTKGFEDVEDDKNDAEKKEDEQNSAADGTEEDKEDENALLETDDAESVAASAISKPSVLTREKENCLLADALSLYASDEDDFLHDDETPEDDCQSVRNEIEEKTEADKPEKNASDSENENTPKDQANAEVNQVPTRNPKVSQLLIPIQGYCTSFLRMGICSRKDNCSYTHDDPPAKLKLKVGVEKIMKAFEMEDKKLAFEIYNILKMNNYGKIPASTIEYLFRLSVYEGDPDSMFQLLGDILNQNLLNKQEASVMIRLCSHRTTAYIAELWTLFECMVVRNISPELDASKILLKAFMRDKEWQKLWTILQYCNSYCGASIPRIVIESALQVCIKKPNVYLEMAVKWFGSCDIPMLCQLNMEVLIDFHGICINCGKNELASMLKHTISNPLPDLQEVTEDGHWADYNQNIEVSPQQTTSEEYKGYLNMIMGCKLSKNWEYLASLFIDLCGHLVYNNQHFIKHYSDVLFNARIPACAVNYFKDFLENIKLKFHAALHQDPNLQYDLDKPALAKIGNSLLLKFYEMQLWENGYQLLFILHQFGINYNKCLKTGPYDTITIAVDISVKSRNAESALQILDSNNWIVLQQNNSSNVINVLQILIHMLLENGLTCKALHVLHQLLTSADDLIHTIDLPWIFNHLIDTALEIGDVKSAMTAFRLHKNCNKMVTLEVVQLRRLIRSCAEIDWSNFAQELCQHCLSLGAFPGHLFEGNRKVIVLTPGMTSAECFLIICFYLDALYSMMCNKRNTGHLSEEDFQVFVAVNWFSDDANLQVQYFNQIANTQHAVVQMIMDILKKDINPSLEGTYDRTTKQIAIFPESLKAHMQHKDDMGRRVGLMVTSRPQGMRGHSVGLGMRRQGRALRGAARGQVMPHRQGRPYGMGQNRRLNTRAGRGMQSRDNNWAGRHSRY